MRGTESTQCTQCASQLGPVVEHHRSAELHRSISELHNSDQELTRGHPHSSTLGLEKHSDHRCRCTQHCVFCCVCPFCHVNDVRLSVFSFDLALCDKIISCNRVKSGCRRDRRTPPQLSPRNTEEWVEDSLEARAAMTAGLFLHCYLLWQRFV